MRNFKELNVWQHAHSMTKETYVIIKNFPDDERFGLVSQLRRSAASVPANIAEGCGRNSNRDFARFLSIAAGSACETEYHFFLAYELGFIDKNSFHQLDVKINEIKKMLNSFIQKLTMDF